MKKFFSAMIAFGISYGICNATSIGTQSEATSCIKKRNSSHNGIEKRLCSEVVKSMVENKSCQS